MDAVIEKEDISVKVQKKQIQKNYIEIDIDDTVSSLFSPIENGQNKDSNKIQKNKI